MIAKSIVIKGRGGKFGGCAVKAVGLTSGGLRRVPRRAERFARAVIVAQKSAEGIVVARSDEGPNDGRVIRTASSCGQCGRITS